MYPPCLLQTKVLIMVIGVSKSITLKDRTVTKEGGYTDPPLQGFRAFI